MHYNLVNEAMSCKKSSTNPTVGMCGTMFCGSDRWPMVVTEVLSKKKIRLAHMSSKDYNLTEKKKDQEGNEYLPDACMREYARVSHEDNKIVPDGKIYTFRKNHRWMEEGSSLWSTGAVHLGEADEYRDPSF